ncbi:uncharacterized protein [Paralichthys olivaceus]|uniref:uncharacterized protein isoform X2 n=1 Tax=Paralichthys olivaceus TaxID=8255 RepID=UPI0037539743
MAGLVLLVIFISSFHEIQLQALFQPKLVMNTSAITETDTVTMHCQPPPAVLKCYFYTEGQETKIFPCLKTLSGTELLLLAHKSSPAEVKVRCFYTVKLGHNHSPSLHSNTSSITIRKTVEIESHEMQTTPFPMSTGLTVSTRNPKENVIATSHLSSPSLTPVKTASGLTVSTRSPKENVVSTLQTPLKVTSGLEVHRPHTSTPLTSIKGNKTTCNLCLFPSIIMMRCMFLYSSGLNVTPRNSKEHVNFSFLGKPEIRMLTLVAVSAGFGVTVGVISLGLGILSTRRRSDSTMPVSSYKLTGTKKLSRRESQNEQSDDYHTYHTIAEKPPERAPEMVYSTLQLV